MTPTELREARATLGLSTAGLAIRLDMGTHGGRTVRRWEAGAHPIPGMAAVAIALMLERHSRDALEPHCDFSHNAWTKSGAS